MPYTDYTVKLGDLKKAIMENPYDPNLNIDGYMRYLKYNTPSAQSEQRWIPCSERLPKDGSWNIFTDGKNVSVERYKEDAIDHFFPNGRWFEFDDAVAWMPLPEWLQRKETAE